MTHFEVSTEHCSKEFNKQLKESLNSAKESFKALKDKKCLGSEMTGWFDWPRLGGFNLLKELKKWQNNFYTPYDCVLVIGIGGSYAGAKALADIYEHKFSSELLMQGKELKTKSL